MKILELYAGSGSIKKAAKNFGFQVFSIDIYPFTDIDLVMDIEYLKPNDIPFKPDMVWASPPCTSYSVAAISKHRNKQKPISDFAHKSDRLIINTLKIINYYNCIYYIENPRGMLRKMDFMKNLPRKTVWYCQYQDLRAKPTDIFSNNFYSLFNPFGWQPKKECSNNNKFCEHQKSPRGSKTGTQGLIDSYERSKIPYELCTEIIQATYKTLTTNIF